MFRYQRYSFRFMSCGFCTKRESDLDLRTANTQPLNKRIANNRRKSSAVVDL